VDAAVDWARRGRTDPIDEYALGQLWPSYLTPGQPATDDALAAALAWALRPVAGRIALLQRSSTGSYQAFDYIVRVVRDRPAAAPPVDASWTAAVESAVDGQALAVGVAVYRYARLDRSIEALSRALESSLDQVAAIAGYNLGVALGELNRSEEEIATYDALDARYHQDPEPAIREQVANALVNKGVTLGALGRSEEAIATYDALAGGLVAAVQHVGDVVDLLGTWGGVPGGGQQVDVPEPGRDGVHRHAGLEAVRGPVGAQRVRVRQPLRHAGGRAAATHEPVHADSGQGEGLLVPVTAQPHEQGLLVEQPDAAGEGMDLQPRLERLLHGQRHRDLALATALAAHEQAIVPRV
jgi:hypothetical protein